MSFTLTEDYIGTRDQSYSLIQYLINVGSIDKIMTHACLLVKKGVHALIFGQRKPMFQKYTEKYLHTIYNSLRIYLSFLP